jgi:hypothetical protein
LLDKWNRTRHEIVKIETTSAPPGDGVKEKRSSLKGREAHLQKIMDDYPKYQAQEEDYRPENYLAKLRFQLPLTNADVPKMVVDMEPTPEDENIVLSGQPQRTQSSIQPGDPRLSTIHHASTIAEAKKEWTRKFGKKRCAI